MDATLPLFDDYKVSLEAFEGPLDLLLHMIRKEEVDIYDIPIGRIASQYLAYLEQMRSLDINVAGEFVVMAATLSRHLRHRGMAFMETKYIRVKQKPPQSSMVQWVQPRQHSSIRP